MTKSRGIYKPRARRPVAERFWEKVDKTETCWLWTGALSNGYGSFKPDEHTTTAKAHRFAYEQLVGPIPEGLHLDHLCREPRCVRPSHLEPVTCRENVVRGVVSRIGQDRCENGHELTPENTYTRPSGHRRCRTCTRAFNRARNTRRRVQRLGPVVGSTPRYRCTCGAYVPSESVTVIFLDESQTYEATGNCSRCGETGVDVFGEPNLLDPASANDPALDLGDGAA